MLQHPLAVDPAAQPVGLDAHAQMVPLARPVGLGRHVGQDRPGIDVRPLEAGQPQLARRGVKTVVTVAAVGAEHQACRPRLVLQAHIDRHLDGVLRQGRLPEAERTAAEAAARGGRLDDAGMLRPARAEQGFPEFRIEHADGQPALHGHRIRLGNQALQFVDRHGETEVFRACRLQRQDAQHAPLAVEQGAAAVALLDRQRQADHRDVVDQVRVGRDHTVDDAEGQPLGVAHGHDRLPLLDRFAVAEGQRLQRAAGDAQQRQIPVRIGGGHLDHLVLEAVGRLHLQPARLADDVQVRGDQAVRADHKTGPQAVEAVPADLHDLDHARLDLGGDGLDRLRGGCRQHRAGGQDEAEQRAHGGQIVCSNTPGNPAIRPESIKMRCAGTHTD